MSIGLIIFIISIIISIITAINDKSHKQRQNQKNNRQQPNAERKKSKNIFEQLGDTFDELQKEFDDTSKKATSSEKRSSKQLGKIEPKRKERKTKRAVDHAQNNERNQPRNVTQKHLDEVNELNQTLSEELYAYRNDIDREKEKQLSTLERRAREILNDKYLSNRAKKVRLEQLFANSKNLNNNFDNKLRFDEDEVLNGIVWSEILSKPKQLR